MLNERSEEPRRSCEQARGRPNESASLHSERLMEVQDPRDAHGTQASGLAAGR